MKPLLRTGVLISMMACAAAGAPVAEPSALAPAASASTAQASLLLLGTGGGPGGRVERAGIASLVTVKGRHYLVDAGEGVSRQLARAAIRETDLPVVFLSHLHDDHTAGLSPLMTFAYTLRGRKMELIGPPGTERLAQGMLASLQPNAEIRMVENRLPLPPSGVFTARDVQPGLIYSDENVRVLAVENSHYHARGPIPLHETAKRNRSYSFRFETPNRVIAFTGDTDTSDAVTELVRDADIMVSEMVTEADAASLPEPVRKTVPLGHLTPAEVGQLAARANVKMLVLSHIGIVGPADLAEVRRHFSGRIVLGQDLQRF